ncbi:MAG: FlgD immunoglobulin-like domain containing protein [Armatimonadota bacterium]
MVLPLSAEARVDVTIVNIAGRVVRRLATDRSLPAGVTRMAWNGGSDAGTTVPAGRYLVRVRAAAQGGRASTALTGLQVRR